MSKTKQKEVFRIDREAKQIYILNQPFRFPPLEFRILDLLESQPNKCFSREELLNKLWGHEKEMQIDTRTIDQHVARIRVRSGFRLIETVTCFGYRWVKNPTRHVRINRGPKPSIKKICRTCGK